MSSTISFSYHELKAELVQLLKNSIAGEKAELLAEIFCEAEFDGVQTHGLKRFPRLLDEIQQGWIDVDAEVEELRESASWLLLDGHAAPGPLSARYATLRAVEKAQISGFAMAALRNTNHWLRPGYYANLAARAGKVLLCWSNTLPNMLAHSDHLKEAFANIGNNPLAVGIPNGVAPVIFDSALSQFSYGKMQEFVDRGEDLPFAGGYDKGEPSCDAKAIMEQMSASAIGWWKGSGLSVVLDLLAALLSGGQSVLEVGREPGEQNISQVFVCVDPRQLWGEGFSQRIADLLVQLEENKVRWPGRSLATTRELHDLEGVHVSNSTWRAVQEAARSFKARN